MMQRDQPTTLHSHGYKAGIYARVVCLLTPCKMLSTYHAGEITRGKLAWYERLDRWTNPFNTHSFSVSKEITQRVLGKSELINNFVNLTKNISSGKQLAFVGRLSKEKGPDIFIQLAKTMPAKNFHIYGDGIIGSQLKQQSPNNIVFHREQKDMHDIRPQIGLLIMTSRHEGLPMAALEAMAQGIPVVAPAVGNLPQLIRHKQNGWLCDTTKLNTYRKVINTWCAYNSSQRIKMAIQARSSIKANYNSDHVIPMIIKHYV